MIPWNISPPQNCVVPHEPSPTNNYNHCYIRVLNGYSVFSISTKTSLLISENHNIGESHMGKDQL